MNMPENAIDNLDVFIGLLRKANPKVWYRDPLDQETVYLPLIHVYGYSNL